MTSNVGINATMTDIDVVAIRRRAAESILSGRGITPAIKHAAETYGLSRLSATFAIRGETYGDVTPTIDAIIAQSPYVREAQRTAAAMGRPCFVVADKAGDVRVCGDVPAGHTLVHVAFPPGD